MRLIFVALLPALIAATPTAAPSPAPASTPLRTIEQLHVSPLCAAMRRVAAPFLQAVQNNDRRFTEIDERVGTLREWTAAGAVDGPALTLNAADIDQLASQSYDDLTQVDLALKHSYEQTPDGSDPALDSVRRRIQAIVDVERVLTDRYETMTSAAGTQAGPKLTSWRFLKSMANEIERDTGSVPPMQALAHAPAPALRSLSAELHSLRARLIPIELNAAGRCGAF